MLTLLIFPSKTRRREAEQQKRGIPTPKEIRKVLDDYVIGQDHPSAVNFGLRCRFRSRMGGLPERPSRTIRIVLFGAWL
jgi:hypothetical protein